MTDYNNIGFGAGFKLFIIDNIYRKYPKVKYQILFFGGEIQSTSLFSLVGEAEV